MKNFREVCAQYVLADELDKHIYWAKIADQIVNGLIWRQQWVNPVIEARIFLWEMRWGIRDNNPEQYENASAKLAVLLDKYDSYFVEDTGNADIVAEVL